MKKHTLFLVLIYLSYGCSNNDFSNRKCLSCDFYLAKKSDDRYVLLHQDINSKKYEISLDHVTNIGWQRCYMFAQSEDKIWIIYKEGEKLTKISLPTTDDMDNFIKERSLNSQIRLDDAKTMYNFLLPRVSCR